MNIVSIATFWVNALRKMIVCTSHETRLRRVTHANCATVHFDCHKRDTSEVQSCDVCDSPVESLV